MPPPGNRLAGAGPELARFLLYLKAERGVSGNTLAGYAADLAQLVSSKWGVSAEPPYPWGTLDEGDARGFLLASAQAGALPATVRRKLASARSFCRFLQRGGRALGGGRRVLVGRRHALRGGDLAGGGRMAAVCGDKSRD